MNYTVHPPPEPLRDYIEHLWTIEVDSQEPANLNLKFFVTSAPCIVFQHNNGHSAIARRIPISGAEVCNGHHPTLFIRGAITRPFQCVTEGAPTAIGVELKPQALSTLFSVDAAELTDRIVGLNAFSTDNLDEQMLNAKSRQHQVALLTRFLMARARSGRPKDALVTQSLRLIEENVGCMQVRNLLKCLNVSERQFERRFARTVGLPASFYLRVIRFQEAVRLMQAGRFERLTDIAYDLRYTDQSHFTKDVKEFTASTPKDLSHAVEECAAMRRSQTLVRQRILIRQNDLKRP